MPFPTKVYRHYHLLAATGTVRTAKFAGRDHLVIPVVPLVEGVIFPVNAETPELVLAEDIGAAPQGWNGRPVFPFHPSDGAGDYQFGNTPELLDKSSFGQVFHAAMKDKALTLEAWLDPSKAEAVGPEAVAVIEKVNAGKMMEVSVGVSVFAEETSGTYNGQTYNAIWHNIVPDHLAIFGGDDIGACSIGMGCGAPRVAKVHVMSAQAPQRVAVIAPQKESPMPPAATTTETPPDKKRTLKERLKELMPKFSVNLSGVTAMELRGKLYEALAAKEPGLSYVEDWDGSQVVYCVLVSIDTWEQEYYQRGYSLDGQNVVVDDTREQVEPVLRFEPVVAMAATFRSLVAKATKAAPLRERKAQEHPFTYCMDVVIPAIEKGGDSVSDPEAFCGWWKAEHAQRSASAKPCSCGGREQPTTASTSTATEGDSRMTKAERIVALLKGGKFTEKDKPWLEAVPEERLEVFEVAAATPGSGSGQPGASQPGSGQPSGQPSPGTQQPGGENKPASQPGSKPEDQGGAENKPRTAAEAKPPTEEEWLATAPPSVRSLVDGAKRQQEARRTYLLGQLKGKQDAYTEEELKTVAMDALERIAKLCKVGEPAPSSNVDFGLNVARRTGPEDQTPPPVSLAEQNKRIAAARNKTSRDGSDDNKPQASA